nr:hypothetical protein [Tanacetum cinerariifolium]
MGTSSGLKTWYLAQCGVKHRSAMINMLFGESLIGGTNVNNSTDLRSTGSLLEMSTQNVESSLSPNYRLSNGMTTRKLTNLTVEERFAFNVSLRMFTKSIVIQRRVEDLQLATTRSDVRTALDDRLNGIRIKYFPQTIWRRSDKERAAAMIQAIDKQLKTRRIMRSLKKFVGGRLYEGDF